MSTKKDKKGKVKKKGKPKDVESGLSDQEKEIYLLTMEELKHKIEWRSHMTAIIEEDVKLLADKLLFQQRDKKEAIKLLEESIEQEKELTEKIECILPEAENEKRQGEERRVRELASKELKIKQEKLSNEAELEVLKKKVKSLEAYRPNKVSQKIKETEKLLEAKDVGDVFRKAGEDEVWRKEYFRTEMQDILKEEADSYQEDIAGKLDEKFERIVEETRWWEGTVTGITVAADRLETINDSKLTKIKSAQNNLKQRKVMSLHESKKMQQREALIQAIALSNKQLEFEKRDISEHQERLNFLDSVAKNLKQNLESQDNNLKTCLNNMKRNEIEINNLEERLSREISFRNKLKENIERAQQLIMEEAKQSLIVTYNGPPEQKNTVQAMRELFKEVTRFIYERKNKSMV